MQAVGRGHLQQSRGEKQFDGTSHKASCMQQKVQHAATSAQRRASITHEAAASPAGPPEASPQQLAQLRVMARSRAGPGHLADAGDGARRGGIQNLFQAVGKRTV